MSSRNSASDTSAQSALPDDFPDVAAGTSVGRLDTHWSLDLAPDESPTENLASALTPAQLFLAWGMVVKAHVGSSDAVVLGANVSDDSVEAHTQEAPKPLAIQLDAEQSIGSHVQAIQQNIEDWKTPTQSSPDLGKGNNKAGHVFRSSIFYSSSLSLTEQHDILVNDDGIVNGTTPLVILCSGEGGNLNAELAVDSNIVHQPLIPYLATQLSRAFKQLRSAVDGKPLKTVSLIGPEDLDKARMLAGRMSSGESSCLHELITDQAESTPDAEASVSWDIRLTYAELDQYSDALALELIKAGVGAGKVVATCLDKSGWVPIIYLAVLKAGGAFAPLNPSLPVDQLALELQILNASVILTNPEYQTKLAGLAQTVMGLSKLEKSLNISKRRPEVDIQPHQPAFIVSTSGTTGTPKHLVMTHKTFASSIEANCNGLDISEDTRMLQMSSYEHHTSVSEIFLTLSQGGCICTPSEEDRLGDIRAVCQRMRPNMACLTPATADLFEPDELVDVESINISGGVMTDTNIRKWASRSLLINAYGLAEVSGFPFMTIPLSEGATTVNLGWPQGCSAWVMDPEDSTRLAPIGAIGELLLEGPSIAQFYLGNKGASRAAFVPRPNMLPEPNFGAQDAGERSCFLTGDLVRFNLADGTLKFVCRKDSNCKLPAYQKTEQLIRESLNSVRQVAVVIPERGACANSLVALVSFEGEKRVGKLSFLGPERRLKYDREPDSICVEMRRCMPPREVPSVWFAVTELPISASGKVDHKAIAAWANDMDDQDINQRIDNQLKLEIETGGRPANAPGGQNVAARSEFSQAESLALGEGLGLPTDRLQYSRTVQFRLKQSTTPLTVKNAIENLVIRHPALRTVLTTEGGKWLRDTQLESTDAFSLNVHDASSAVSAKLSASRSRLDLANGPLLVADFFPSTGELALAALQITLDLPSWRTVTKDLDALISGSNLPQVEPIVATPTSIEDRVASVESNLKYWELEEAEEVYLPREMNYELILDPEVSQKLLQITDTARNAPVDLIVAATIQSFSESFTDRSVPTIYVVSNEQDPETNAVGYSETTYPVDVVTNTGIKSTPDLVAQVSESRAKITSSSLPRVSADQPPEILVSFLDNQNYTFNGKALDQTEDSLSDAKEAAIASLIPACISITGKMQEDDRLSVVVAHSWDLGRQKKIRKWIRQLEGTLGAVIRATATEAVPLSYTDFPLINVENDDAWQQVHKAISSKIGPVSRQAIEDLYPCSPVQQGILLSQVKSMSSYQIDIVWKIQDKSSHVSLTKVEMAWDAVVRQHPAMRTIFVDGLGAGEPFLAVVLQKPSYIVKKEKLSDGEDLESFLASQPDLEVADHQPPHVLTIAATQDPSSVLIHLRASHAITDGISLDAIQQHLASAYSDEHVATLSIDIVQKQPVYNAARDYIRYIREQDNQASLSFWKKNLVNVSNCHFPRLTVPDTKVNNVKRLFKAELSRNHITALNRLCREQNVTISSLVQVAWGLILRAYTGNPYVCFGYMTSGRDAPIDGIDSGVGVFINMLVSSLSLEDDMTLKQVLTNANAAFADSLEHQYCPLVKIQSALQLGSQPLFNTALSCYRELEPEQASPFTSVTVDPVHIDDVSEYSIGAKVSYTRTKLEMTLTYWTAALSPEAAEVVGKAWMETLKSLPTVLDKKVSNINLFDSESDRIIRQWNHHMADSVDLCIHDVLSKQASKVPNKVALDSTAGKLTYGELDDYSTRLAHHLIKLGAVVESIIPLIFEKSVWTVVAMMAVWKAGAAFVALDPGHPTDRQAMILSDLNSPVAILSAEQSISPAITELIATTGVRQWILTPESVLALPKKSTKACGTVTPDDAAYIIFTSGSTGKPKGVVVHHRALSTSIEEHGKAFGFHPEVRMMHFASYAFDATFTESITPLAFQGSVCIGSEAERIEDLAGFINRFKVNWIVLTPAIARMLNPGDVPTLRTLICGGDAIGDLVPRKWSDKLRFLQVYGPTETTIVVSLSDRQNKEVRPAMIGHMFTSAAWIVNPRNHDILMPVGAAGELLIEGPVLARGYRNDPEKTGEVFIENPSWSRNYPRHSPSRRLYKTGDVVRLNMDGSMDFIQRKDTQIKIRGQRVEAGEIENTIEGANERIQHVFVTFLKEGLLKSRLIGVISIQELGPAVSSGDGPRLLSGKDQERAKKVLSELTDYLSAKLPRHMVPQVWALIEGSSVPLNSSGKIDRRRIATWLEKADEALAREILSLDEEADVSNDAMTELEGALRSIWASVLNIDEQKIGLDRSFFSLGGDSISAMQMVSHCRTKGIQINVQDVFRCKTVAALATVSKENSSGEYLGDQSDFEERIDEYFPLSPVQKFHLEMNPEGVNHFNQSWLVQIPSTRAVSPDMVRDALRQLVERHSMLRSRFRKTNGQWQQRITNDIDGSLTYKEHSRVGPFAVDGILTQTQKSLDIQTGPLMAADLIQLPDRQLLFMAAHHLVIDLVSWRVLLEELETILTSGANSLPDMKPFSFQNWVDLLAAQAQKWTPADVLPYNLLAPQMDFWGSSADLNNAFGSTRHLTFTLDKDVTQSLLGPSNDALQTDPQDLFLAAAFQSFSEVFIDRPLPTIFTEGHGREADVIGDIDLSRTVAWFTSISPVALASGVQPDLIETLKRTKDARRALPNKGVPYFASRYLNAQSAKQFAHHSQMEILFNYQGQYQQMERSDVLLQAVADSKYVEGDIDSSIPRLALIDIAAAITEGRATVSLTVPKSFSIEIMDRISHWLRCFQLNLIDLVGQTNLVEPSFSLSDLSLIKDITYSDLDEIEALCKEHVGQYGPQAIEEIFPCSSMQQGILMSQSRKSDLYDVRIAMEITSPGVEAEQLKEAWAQLVRRQPMLRTVFIPNLRGSGSFDQIILRNAEPIVREVEAGDDELEAGDEWIRSEVSAAPISGFEYGELPHEFVIYTAGSKLYIMIRLSHALVDGACLPLIIQEFRQAYAQRLPASPARSYRELIAFTQKQSQNKILEYWCDYLRDITPSRLPPLLDGVVHTGKSELKVRELTVPNVAALKQLCADHGFTLSNLVQAAWALVLRAYTGEDSVSFGYLASGRDAPIDGIQQILGPFINMLICHVTFDDENTTVLQLLQKLRDDILTGIGYQYVSLAEVQHALEMGSEPLFNSVISFQRNDPVTDATDGDDGLGLAPVEARDPTEYDISLNVVDVDDLEISFSYWTSKVSDNQATHVIRALLTALAGFTQDPNQTVTCLSLVSPETRKEMDEWNMLAMPVTAPICVHKLIEMQTRVIRSQKAIESWDRNFTYLELDQAANAFAHYIKELGNLRPDTFVVTCFEKSAWTIVAQLAILKAGAAFAAVDPTHPVERIAGIVSDLGHPSILLTCTKYEDRLRELFPHVVLVNKEQLVKLDPQKQAPKTTTQPDNTAYSIFTSGSTGRPKGINIEHQSISTAALSHATRLHLDRSSRVLQFAAYTFDLSVGDIFYTLVNGGCICVPSDRQRVEDLAGAINSLKVNWMFLTPTLADMLEPDSVPTLKTLLLGGEAPTAENVRRWSERVHLILAYGPAETTIWSNCNSGVSPATDPANFGPALGSAIWVADMQNPEVLLPVGAMGELLVEGPLVARGYIGDPAKTAAAFIPKPKWLADGYDRHVYRSGDIVRYNPDGSCSFVRRRDNQVKVRGQRVELNEVEVHVTRANAGLQHAIVLLPKEGACKGRLSVVISYVTDESPEPSRSIIPIRNNKASQEKIASIRNYLMEKLPGYMVPKVWIAVEEIPCTVNGKIDRRQVAGWVHSLTDNDLASIVGQTAEAGEGSSAGLAKLSPMEKHLAHVWSQVLNLPLESLPIDQSFTSLGGDSISAMQVVSRGRERGIIVTVHNILRCQSLMDLASQCRFKSLAAGEGVAFNTTVDYTKDFPLLPIQRMFFEQMPEGLNHYNQQFTVRLNKNFSAAEIERALAAVVQAHPMLRARFYQQQDKNNQWTQKVIPDSKGSFRFETYVSDSLIEAQDRMNETQASLNIRQGPLLAVDLIDLPEYQVLFLAAHHLVIDLVSWRIVLEDLENLLSRHQISAEVIPVPAWSNELIQQATKYDIERVLPFTVPAADFAFWAMDGVNNVFGDTHTIERRLDAASTRALLGSANTAFGTDPTDLMVAALFYSFGQVFTDRALPALYTESHGRAAWDDSIDLSRSVGWFTTIFPLVLQNKSGSELGLIQACRKVKDMRRSIPEKGLPYFITRYLTDEGRSKFKDHTNMEILFNYLGQFQQLQQSDNIIEQLSEGAVETEDTPPTTSRLALLDVMAAVQGEELVLSLTYNKKMQHCQRLEAWMERLQEGLQRLSSELSETPASFTSGDFPLLGLDDDGLTDLAGTVHSKIGSWGPSVVEKAFPCSPIQQGMLVSQSKDATSYLVKGVWKIKPPQGQAFQPEQLEKAWLKLIQHHAIFRTMFFESGRADGISAQIVLKDAAFASTIIKTFGYKGHDPIDFLQSAPSNLRSDKPPIMLQILTTAHGGDAYICIEVSHTLIDGTSFAILIDDLRAAYHNGLRGSGVAYSDYISYIYQQSFTQSLDYWKNTLADTQTCNFPILSTHDAPRKLNKVSRIVPNVELIRNLCRIHDVSVTNLFQVAWSMVLRAFTGMSNVCFGYVNSGRDVPIDGIEKAVGPFINILICQAEFETSDEAKSALHMVKDMRSSYINSLPHQHSSLGDIQHALGFGNKTMFNTAISLQKMSDDGDQYPDQIKFDSVEGHDPSEFNMTLNILDMGEFIELHLAHWTDVLSDECAAEVVNTTIQALELIVQDPTRKLPVVNLITENSYALILDWNSSYQEPIESTVPQLINAHIKEAPASPAITSWDGDLTYGELGLAVTRLASYLRSLGVVPEVTVPFCFRKSLWAPVAMLAIMRAGGSFVPLDPTHPQERMRSIIQQLPTQTVAIASPETKHLLEPFISNVIALNADFCDRLPNPRFVPYTATSDNLAYILFTSGSTGLPKGVMLHHRAFCTSTTAHGVRLGFNKYTRSAQFSSYTFDACIIEIFTTLIYGGCVCILSEAERMNGLVAAFNRMKVNWSAQTPAVASTIDPASVPTLRTIIIGGEAIPHSVINKWNSGSCRFIQVYGPTECCVVCLGEDRTGRPIAPEVLGSAMGCTAWVVDPQDASILMPIGAVGELLIQGPIQARGYLNDEEKTNSAFLRGLPWLPEEIRGESLYKTGDLVRYNANNTINFIRRKDTQVKVRGQRIELSEIDYQIASSHEDLETRLVLIGSEGRFSGKIVAVIAFRDLGIRQDGCLKLLEKKDERAKSQEKLAQIQNFVAEKLPSYMHPHALIVVNSLPINTSGKIDSRQVKSWVHNLDDDAYQHIMNLDESDVVATEPTDEAERVIQAAISEAINLPLQQIAMNRSFISLGGDSITAMQVMASCRRNGFSLPVQDILKSPSIRVMSTKAEKLGSATSSNEATDKENVLFPLSPVQNIHFLQCPDGENHYNQSMLVKLRQQVNSSELADAIQKLVSHHSMLRARFVKNTNSGEWSQKISSQVKESFSFDTFISGSWDEARSELSIAGQSLDITRGPLIAVRQFEVASTSALFLVAHHLVIDLVSWRTLLRQLEQLINGVALPKDLFSASFQQWTNSLHSYVDSNAESALRLPFELPVTDLDFWGLGEFNNDFNNLIQGSFTCSTDTTNSLVHEASRVLNVEVFDVLLALAAHTFNVVFPERQSPVISTETHGREHPLGQDANISVHETVGWFTAIAPFVLHANNRGFIDSIIRAKDMRRDIANSGVPYFTAQMLSQKIQKSQMFPLEILFNFFGRFQQFEKADGLFEPLPSSLGPSDVKLSADRLALIDLSGVIEKDQLTISWVYNKSIKHQAKISRWLSLYEQTLTDVVNDLQKATAQLTRSDIPLLSVSHDELGQLNRDLSKLSPKGVRAIEDAYPLSPMQRGILLSQSKDSGFYDVHGVWEITHPTQNVDLFRLNQSWDRVVQRHPMLRTVFCRSVREDSFLDQVVLKSFHPAISHFIYDDDEEDEQLALQQLWEAGNGPYASNAPNYRLALCSQSTGRKVFAHFQVNHALIDASSLAIILRDWKRAYAGTLLDGPGPSYASYIAHIQKTTLEASVAFWSNLLKGVTSCRLPRLTDSAVAVEKRLQKLDTSIPSPAGIRNVAKRLGVSLANVIQLAWGLVLRSYTGEREVCFGYLTSGRDVEIDGIQDAVGPFINILVSRLVFEKEKTLASMLENLFNAYIDSLPHQFASLADIKHALGLGSEQLFNTAMSFQKVSSSSVPEESQLSFTPVRGNDPTEYDLTINVIETDEEINVNFVYWNTALSEGQTENLFTSFVQSLKAIELNAETSVDEIDVLPTEHASQLLKWNENMPEDTTARLHDLFRDVAQRRPDAPAVCGWDKTFSFAELDRASTSLAYHLINSGVKPNSFIAVLFEKSAWIVVAWLAIIKAGAAFMLMDPEAPIERLRTMVTQAKAPMIVCSSSSKSTVDALSKPAIVVNEQTVSSMHSTGTLPTTSATSPAYIIFTSGTTGTPKGSVIEHHSFGVSAIAQAKGFKITPQSRCLQFASYTFDASITEMITPLLAGACVCIPRQQDLTSNFAGAIAEMNVNWTVLTPSFIQTVNREEVPSIKTLVVAGEAPSQRDFELWSSKLDMINAYGPSECSVCSSVKQDVNPTSDPSNIGRPCGCALWVTDAEDPNHLLPIGCIGELLIEGPTLARCYLDEPEKSEAAFVSGLSWASRMGRTPETRFYRSGDLVRLNSDGTYSILGRKDTQVKIHGQRMELGEIEYQLSRFNDIHHSMVMAPKKGPLSNRLTAILSLKEYSGTITSTPDTKLELLDSNLKPKADEAIAQIRDTIFKSLPKYMVPTTWIVVQAMPAMISGKLHRPAIKAWVEELDNDTYKSLGGSSAGAAVLGAREQIAMQISEKLSSLLSNAQEDIQADEILGKNIIPVQCGLDSITAIALSNWIRKTYNVTIPLAAFLSTETSIRTLASLAGETVDTTDTMEETKSQEPTSAGLDLRKEIQKYESRLTELVLPDAKTSLQRRAPTSVLLTGATGFLGSQILKELVQRSQVTRVVCLVRADSDKHAMDRVIESAEKGQWWRPRFSHRLEAWSGDLAQSRLGLSESKWRRIGSGGKDGIDAIIHNGALVHWHIGYNESRESNVNSTVDLLSAWATGPRPSKFMFVTGGYMRGANETDEETLDILREADGYSQSKFISEMLSRRQGERSRNTRPDMPIPTIISPGLIIGDAVHGVSNLDDYLWRVVASAVRINGYNAEEGEDVNNWLVVAGSDQIAAATVDACLEVTARDTKSLRFVDGVPVKDFWQMMRNQCGFQLQPLSAKLWMKRLEEDMDREGPSHPLFPVFDFLNARGGNLGAPRFTDGKPVFSQKDTLLRLQRSVEYLKRIGFLGTQGKSGAGPLAGFKRTGLKLTKTSFF